MPTTRPILYLAPKSPSVGLADYCDNYRQALQAAKIEYVDEAVTPGLPTRAEVAAIRRRCRQLVATGEIKRYSAIHVEIARFSYKEYFYAQALSKQTAIPVLATLHEPSEVVDRPYRYLGLEAMPRPLRVPRKILDEVIGLRQRRQLLHRLPAIVTLGPKAEADLARWGTLPTPRFQIKQVSQVVRRRPHRGRVRILYGGFYSPEKGLHVLLGAYAKLLEREPSLIDKAVLVITGGAFEKGEDRLEQEIKASGIPAKAIERTPFLDDQKLQALYAGGDVAVLPYQATLRNGASAMLIRALAAGLATVASDLPVIRQDVTPDRTALLFPPTDKDALSEVLLRLVEDAKLRKQLGQRAQQQIKTENSPQTVGKQIREIYSSVSR